MTHCADSFNGQQTVPPQLTGACWPQPSDEDDEFFKFLESSLVNSDVCTSDGSNSTCAFDKISSSEDMHTSQEACCQRVGDAKRDGPAAPSSSRPIQTQPSRACPSLSCCGAPVRRRGLKTGDAQGAEAHQVRRVITNDTYLRRLYVPPQQTVALFPTLLHKFRLEAQLGQSNRKKSVRFSYRVRLVNEAGRHWSATCTCYVYIAGAQHCQLVDGWAHFCRDNNVQLGDTVVLKRSRACSTDIVVTVNRVSSL